MNQTFARKERLRSKKLIGALFKNGSSLSVCPFRLIWMETALESGAPVQMAVSVPKARFASAAHRNRIKRIIRECYRKNKGILVEPVSSSGKQFAMMLVYIAHEQSDYHEMEHKIILTLQRFIKHEKIG